MERQVSCAQGWHNEHVACLDPPRIAFQFYCFFCPPLLLSVLQIWGSLLQ
uniref:Uncharacterized protein n=1 Tax=Rhizophora mucronata TaxID=61149 RepID=A0A2P2PFR1_RHIMU